MKSIHTRFRESSSLYSAETQQAIRSLEEDLEHEECRFGSKAIPSFLKPHFLSLSETRHLQAILGHLTRILEKVVQAYFRHPELRPIFGLSKEAERLVGMDTGFSKTIVIARPDAFLNRGRFQFLEFNCDSPAGAGYADVLERFFKKSPPMRHLSGAYRWHSITRCRVLLNALVACYLEFGGRKARPQIAIVDWKHLRTFPEFVLIQHYFESLGYPTLIADPRELKFRRGRLAAGGRTIDLVYRRIIFDELLTEKKSVSDFLKAYRLGKICIVNPFRSRLAANKAVLSILTNPAYDFLFTPEENELIARHVPWTRRVIDTRKFYGGKTVYLKQFIDENKDALVLKPAEGYGGRDVKIGLETSKQHWRRTMQRAIRGGERWVVQEFVPIPSMDVPLENKGRVHFAGKKININPFLFGGRYAGAMARLSDERVINVSVGGGLVPTVTYSKR